jgi:hypothetical protein
MKNTLQLIVLAYLIMGLTACQESGVETMEATPKASSAAKAQFGEDFSKKGCEILTAELVATTFDVAADALSQMQMLGCRYDWQGEDQILEASISMLRVHDTEAAAAGWFASATKNRTAEEMQAQLDRVAEQLEASEQLDTAVEKSMAKSVLSAMGTKAVHFDDLPGVGNEARVNDDGSVYVRVRNLTFTVSAYKGAPAPPADFKGVDLQQMAEVAKQAAAEWAAATAPQRRSDGERLARAIAEEL